MRSRKYLRRAREAELDMELNIAPIIDCFIVVIAFLLVSASFITIGAIDAGSAGASPTDISSVTTEAKRESIELAVQMKTNRALIVTLSGDKNDKFEIISAKGAFDLGSLAEKLGEIKKSFPSLDSANLNADDGVLYQDVIRTLEGVRGHIPNVYLDTEAVK